MLGPSPIAGIARMLSTWHRWTSIAAGQCGVTRRWNRERTAPVEP
jgi:hypothetical protein